MFINITTIAISSISIYTKKPQPKLGFFEITYFKRRTMRLLR